MMKKLNPLVKTGLELGPLILFFLAFMRWKDEVFVFGGTEYSGFIMATALLVPLLVVSTLILWRLTGTLSGMQIMTLVLVVVLGAMTVWLNNESFIKMKPTLLYLFFAILLGIGLLRGQNWLELVMAEALPMRPEGWRIFTQRMILLFLTFAVVNELIWRNLSDETWIKFKIFGLPILMIAFIAANLGLFKRHAIEDKTR